MAKKLVFFSIVLITVFSCNVAKQVNQMKAFAKCDFRIGTVENIRLAGVNVQQVSSINKLPLMDAGRITAAYATGSLPVTMQVNVEAKNPNPVEAAMNKIEWILTIDGKDLISGSVNKNVKLAANGGTALVPVDVSFDLLKVLTGEQKNDLLNMGFNLVGAGNTPSRIGMKIKPSVLVAGIPISYPGYIAINKDFGGAK